MFGPERFQQIAETVLRHSGADQTEVLFMAGEEALTRFANSYIHQNIARGNAQVSVPVSYTHLTLPTIYSV